MMHEQWYQDHKKHMYYVHIAIRLFKFCLKLNTQGNLCNTFCDRIRDMLTDHHSEPSNWGSVNSPVTFVEAPLHHDFVGFDIRNWGDQWLFYERTISLAIDIPEHYEYSEYPNFIGSPYSDFSGTHDYNSDDIIDSMFGSDTDSPSQLTENTWPSGPLYHDNNEFSDIADSPHNLSYLPQGGENYSVDALKALFAGYVDVTAKKYNLTPDAILRYGEKLFDTLLACYHSETWFMFLLQIKIYVQHTFNLSATSVIADYIAKLFSKCEEDIEEDERRFTTQAGEKCPKPSLFRQMFGDWKGIINGEFLKKISQAFACIVSLGYCTMSNIPFCADRFEAFYKKSGIADYHWSDLITMIMDTIIFVFDNCVSYFRGECAFMDILRSPSASYSYEVELRFLQANIKLYEDNELHLVNIAPHEYEIRLDEISKKTRSFYERATGPERRLMALNILTISQLENRVITSSMHLTIREAPFTFCLVGETSVGKTAVTTLLYNVLMRANGFNAEKKFFCSINASDAYQSEVHSWHKWINCDDFGNTKAEHEKGVSTQLIIDYVNNDPKCALKADVDSKGKVFIKPSFFTATTNVKDLDAHYKSNEPLSILRRMGYFIEMIVKPEFRKTGTHFLDPSKMVNTINDAWYFSVTTPIPIPKQPDQIGPCQFHWQIANDSVGTPMTLVSLDHLISFLVFKSRDHFVQQDRLIRGVEQIHDIELCPHDSYSSICRDCKVDRGVAQMVEDEELDTQAGELVIYEDTPSHNKYIRFFERFSFDFSFREKYKCVYNLLYRGRSYKFINASSSFVSGIVSLLVNIGVCLLGCNLYVLIVNSIIVYYIAKAYIIVNLVQDIAEDIKRKGMKAIQPVLNKKYHILAGAGIAIALVALVKKIRNHHKMIKMVFDTQGSNYSTPLPDKEEKENHWLVPEIVVPPCSAKVSTTTLTQVVETVKSITTVAVLENSQGNACICNVLPIKGNVYLAPYHVFRKNYVKIGFKRSHSLISNNRECPLDPSMWRRIKDTDLVLVCLPSMGDNKDITHLFPLRGTSWLHEVVTWIYKKPDLSVVTYNTRATHRRIAFTDSNDDSYDYRGWEFQIDIPTKTGMCGAPIVCNGVRPMILGLHSAGVDGTVNACAHYIEYEDVMETYDKLFNRQPGSFQHINVQCASTGDMILDFPKYNYKHLGINHRKSPFNFHDSPAVVILYGAHDGQRRRFKSMVQPTFISDFVIKHLGLEVAHGPPMNMSNYKPWHADSIKATRNVCLDHVPLKHAVADFESTIFEFLDDHEEYKDILHPMSRVATLSGVDACRGIDAIKLGTSAGFPRCKPKRNFVFESEDEHEFITRPLDVSEEIWTDVENLELKLKSGERVYFIHRINLKDEPIALGKEKVRTFAGCSLECLILVRMYFLPIAKMMMDNPELFECAVGVNAHGPEWTKITEHMQKHGAHRTVAGDHKDYDLMVWCVLVLIAFSIMIEIATWAGYSEEQITLMRGLATELCYGLTEYNGEYVMFLNRNLSGHPLTVFINNIVNCLYCRYSYYDIWIAIKSNNESWINGLMDHLNLSKEVFEEWKSEFLVVEDHLSAPPRFASVVSLMCYGDDNKMSISEDINFFNHTTMQYSLKRVGLEYTMADKLTATKPFIDATECSFLKRHSVWSDEFGQYLGPLELKSLQKTLHSCVASKVITREQQAAEALDSVVRELFYHGKEVFNEWRDKLELVLIDCELQPYFKTRSLHTYDFLRSEYVRKYLSKPDTKHDSASNSIDEIAKTEFTNLDTQSLFIPDIGMVFDACLYEGIDPYLGMCSPAQKVQPHTYDNSNVYVVIKWITDNNKSSMMLGPETHQNVVFRDGSEQWNVEMNGFYDDTRKVAMDQTTSLEDFFRRPVRYNIVDWVPGSIQPYSQIFDPWDVFFTNKRVANRICNFKLLQCTLKVKFLINGNSFYYGRLMVDYAPLVKFRNIEKFDTLNVSNLVPASQRMHLFLDPTTSQGGELHLPFVHPRNALDIPSAMWTDMGNLYMRELTPLKHANGATQNVSISCYIWAENVVLSIPTTVNSGGLTTQGGDEYATKPISNIASTIADIANRLTSIPVIGPYMKATSMMSSSLGSVVKLFGYSRPVQIENSMINKPRLMSQMAVTDVGDMCSKLTVDSKQELSIDPKIVGLDVDDEMIISKIAGKESYLNSFTWATTAVTDEHLWNVRCHPLNCVQDTTTNDVTLRLPACAFAALPFYFWRGTLRYRFQIVASDHHRGRLRFVWDPNYIASAESNVAFTRIVDLCNERDFVIDVAWGQTQSYLDCINNSGFWFSYSTSAYPTAATWANGVLGVYVLNDLTTPNSSINNDIKINVFVSMCDDCEFASPNDNIRSIKYNPQGGDDDGSFDDMMNAPVIDRPTDNILPCLAKDHTNDVYFGEKISSFRQLLKRYCYHNSILCPTAGDNTWSLNFPDFPVYRGTFNYGYQFNNAVPPAAANINRNSFLQYFGAAFLAKRGGVRWKYCYNTDKPSAQQYMTVVRIPLNNAVAQSQGVTPYDATSSTLFSNNIATVKAFSSQGLDVTSVTQQPIIEFEAPNYSNNRFAIPQNASSNTTATNANYAMYSNRHQVTVNNSSTARSFMDLYVAGAEDLTFIGFQGCPPISFSAL